MNQPHPRILVLVDTSTGWGRRVIRGIANYGLKHGPWQLLVEEEGLHEAMRVKPGLQGDGIIARVSDKQLYTELVALGKPVVNVSGIILDGVDLPRISTDYDAVAMLALEHFIERGFRSFAYCGLKYRPYEQRHCKAFVKAVEKRGLHCNVFRSTLTGSGQLWEAEREEFYRWLVSLPKPVGMLTWGTSRGRDILNVCSVSGISVPEQVAVLAGEDDDLLCETCHPSLSAIVSPSEQVGYKAAGILDAALRGEAPPSEETLLPPTEVVTRLSTDTLAVSDLRLSKAIQFIRDNVRQPIQVNDVADAVKVSRRALERRFETILGHTPAREIQTARLKVAKKLLRETDMSVADVAAASGYGSNEYMNRVFQKATGHTPLKYRSWVRAT